MSLLLTQSGHRCLPVCSSETVLRLGAKGSDDHALLSFIARAIRAGGCACHASFGPGPTIVDAGGWALLPGRPECRLHRSRFPVAAVPLHSQRTAGTRSLRGCPQHRGSEHRHQRRWRVGLGRVRTDHWTAPWSARWRVCRCFWRCWHRSGCRRERSPWRFQPHHRASADFASGLDSIERGGRCVVAQATPFAAVIRNMPTTPTNVRFRGQRTCRFALHTSGFDPKRTFKGRTYGLPRESSSLAEKGGHRWPEVVEEHENDRDNPTVHAARNQALDKASNRQERKVRKDRGEEVVAFKAWIDQP